MPTLKLKDLDASVVEALDKQIAVYRDTPANDNVRASLRIREHKQRQRLSQPIEKLKPANDNRYLAKKLRIDWLLDEMGWAARIARCLPPEGPTGYKVAWPEIVREIHEAYGYDKGRRIPITPTSREIERMDRALGWLLLVPERERKIIWSYANGASYRQLGSVFGISHKTMRVDHYTAIILMAVKISLTGGSRFRHIPR